MSRGEDLFPVGASTQKKKSMLSKSTNRRLGRYKMPSKTGTSEFPIQGLKEARDVLFRGIFVLEELNDFR